MLDFGWLFLRGKPGRKSLQLRSAQSRVPKLEVLEDRLAPATLTVTGTVANELAANKVL